MRPRLALVATLCLAAAVLGLLPPAALADRELPPGGVKFEVLNRDGNPEARAGAHPDRLVIRLRSSLGGEPEDVRDAQISLPTGLTGDPAGAAVCSREAFDLSFIDGEPPCPAASQVGEMIFYNLREEILPFDIFNLEPAPGEMATFGGSGGLLGYSRIITHLRPDSGLTMTLQGMPEQANESSSGPHPSLLEIRVVLWGVPADHQEGTPGPRLPLLTLPTRCDKGPISVDARMRMWPLPEHFVHGVGETGAPLHGCADLQFAPQASLDLGSPPPDAPTGVEVGLTMAQPQDPDGLAPSQAKGVRIQLPEGLALSPVAASRLTLCRDAQLALGSEAEAACPPASRVGSVEIKSPQLQAPLAGGLFLGEEDPGDRFRLFAVAKGIGVERKLVGSMRPDPATGRLTATLDDLPETPFERLSLHFDGGPRALLVSPLECGKATADLAVLAYSGATPATPSASSPVVSRPGQGCGAAAPFEPTLRVGVSGPRAGRPVSFSAVIGRKPGEQPTRRFGLVLPPGFSADVGAVATCPDAAAASGACPAKSRIGSAFADVGSGAETVQMPGDVFLTGPYRGEPFGFAMVLDASLGPYRLGSFVVRGAMGVDPGSGEVSVETGTLPEAVEGIPVRFQALGLAIDRPGFLRSPTSCGPKTARATVVSKSRQVARREAEVTVARCVKLPFRPSYAVALRARSELHQGGKPGLQASMRVPSGNANMRAAKITLPPAIRFDASGLRALCAAADAREGRCSKKSRVGSVRGSTRVLEKPMKGAIYVVQPQGSGPPDIWANLSGQGVEFNLEGRTSVRDGRAAARFGRIPDFPLAALRLRFAAGKHGLLKLKESPCGGGLPAAAELQAQNGALARLRTRIEVAGCGDNG
jgi:hypothetical protein